MRTTHPGPLDLAIRHISDDVTVYAAIGIHAVQRHRSAPSVIGPACEEAVGAAARGSIRTLFDGLPCS